jgi:hypothetical protein
LVSARAQRRTAAVVPSVERKSARLPRDAAARHDLLLPMTEVLGTLKNERC